ncbi:MAG: nitroreductase [Thermodesulfobacteriota bacterium]|nr:nitroreductase [Thermodesulfobacteriota bacterium]
MDVTKAIDDRISIRGFTEKPVSREVIEQLLNAARKAPSASNQQPWNFIVVTGETRERLCNDLLEACKKRNKHYDPSWGKTIPPIYLERTKKLLKAIRPHLNEMNQQAVPFLEEGSCLLYGAPVLILVTMDKAHPKSKLVDIGCAVENLVLAAHEKGLGTCIIALILTFEQLIRERLEIADSQALVVGVALGHPDGTLPVNTLRAPKEELTEMTRWIGFG